VLHVGPFGRVCHSPIHAKYSPVHAKSDNWLGLVERLSYPGRSKTHAVEAFEKRKKLAEPQPSHLVKGRRISLNGAIAKWRITS